MKLRIIDEHKFSRIIADLLRESKNPKNPDTEDNAYNWGLVDAERALLGIPVDIIKETRPQ